MVQKIGVLGKGGIGKSTILSHISSCLALQGFKVMQIGNDMALNSTTLLRHGKKAESVLSHFRSQYCINLEDFIMTGEQGIYCLELGSVSPGSGCLARGISLMDEWMDLQKVPEILSLDYIFYDISSEALCTGYSLPIRDKLWSHIILVTDSSYSSFYQINTILTMIMNLCSGQLPRLSLLGSRIHCDLPKKYLEIYADYSNLPLLGWIDDSKEWLLCNEHHHLIWDEIKSQKPVAMIQQCVENFLHEPQKANIPHQLSEEELRALFYGEKAELC